MNNPKCPVCGSKMKGNGTTKAGTKRWRCPKCGASSVRKIDSSAKTLGTFLRWLFSKDAIADLATCRATFWRKTSWVWRLWPIAPFTGEVHDVVHLDGIWLRRKAVVLIAIMIFNSSEKFKGVREKLSFQHLFKWIGKKRKDKKDAKAEVKEGEK